MRLFMLFQPHHCLSESLFIAGYVFGLLSLVFTVYLIPFQPIFWRPILLLPVGDIAGNEFLPEDGVFAADLG